MKLKILTWNIAALPRLINLFGNPSERINGIIEYLKEVDADIICLQEVFDNKIQPRRLHSERQGRQTNAGTTLGWYQARAGS